MPLTADQAIVLACNRCGARLALPNGRAAGLACPECGRSFPCDAGVLLLNDSEPQTQFTDDCYQQLADVESRHFWFAARTQVILAALARRCGSLRGRSALDVGCGTGTILAALEHAGARGYGIDRHLAALHHARRRVRGVLLRDEAARLPFASSFDIVTLCDVIEHVEDDVTVVKSAAAALAPGGTLLVTVPAGPRLWSLYDVAVGHKRRYTREQLLEVMAAAGLEQAQARYFNCVTYPGMRLQRARWNRQSPDRLATIRTLPAFTVPPFPVNQILALASLLDRPLSRVCPFGSSLIATAIAARPSC